MKVVLFAIEGTETIDTFLCSMKGIPHPFTPFPPHPTFALSFGEKHNECNSENSGDDHNNSWNCGAEGASGDIAITQLRERQMRNFLVGSLHSESCKPSRHKIFFARCLSALIWICLRLESGLFACPCLDLRRDLWLLLFRFDTKKLGEPSGNWNAKDGSSL